MKCRGLLTAALLTGSLAFIAPSGRAQLVMQSSSGGPPPIVGSDLAVLEAGEPRNDLPCVATPTKPVLGFDLKFHAGYDISVPLKELAGGENLLTVLFRVIPADSPNSPVYFSHRIRVPQIEEDAKGDAYLQGSFDLGEGKYKVEWLMRDRSERVCASSWESVAELPAKDRQLALTLGAGTVAGSEIEQFIDEPPVQRDAEEGVNVKVLVNFAPQNKNAATLQPIDTSALVSILRQFQREPRIASFSVVAFNLQQQRVLYRQDAASHIDLPAIGKSLEGLQLGRVDISSLHNKDRESQFLGELIRTEVGGDARPDALIFAGPKALTESSIPDDMLRTAGSPPYPVFYMNYNLYPQVTPWRDAIGSAVKFFKGQEFTISRPRDLWYAVTEIVSKVVKSKSGRSAASAAFN